MDILIATQNAGKMREYEELLDPVGAELRFPPDLGLTIDVVEDGATYAANAQKKANAYWRASGLVTLADDSGLEVDALDGAPGIHSARYAPGRDADRVEALLNHLRDVPWERRTARFRCVIVVMASENVRHLVEGVCEGMIACEPMGEGGFGYDPIFYLPDHDCTMAQLPSAEKNRISHRGRASQAAIPVLKWQMEQTIAE